MTDASDVEGVLRAGAPRALGALVRRRGDFEDAEDAMQEALLVNGCLMHQHIGNGAAQFGIDVQVPGMVYASIMQSPMEGAKPKDVNVPDVMKVKGIKQATYDKIKDHVAY